MNTCVCSNSLQATWIRNSTLNALMDTTKLNTRGISMNFVYQHPTISALGKFIHDLTSTGVSRQLGNAVKDMKDLVGKYTKSFPAHKPFDGAAPQGDVVLITGTTGAIGSNTLAELYESPSVTRIIVLARQAVAPVSFRQKRALEERGLDPRIANSSKITLLEGDPALPGLGLGDGVLLELKSVVTHILHIGTVMRSSWCLRLISDLFSLESGFQHGSFVIRIKRSGRPEPDQLCSRFKAPRPSSFHLRQHCRCCLL